MSLLIFIISNDVASTTSMGKLCHCLNSLYRKTSFCLNRVSCVSVCGHCLLSFQLVALRRVWLSLCLCLLYLYTLLRLQTPSPSLLWVKQYQHPQLATISEVLQSLYDREPFCVLHLSWKYTNTNFCSLNVYLQPQRDHHQCSAVSSI